ncbi:hypothetical protein TWF696_003040 [Orbilia brochopaga]|uniref:Uncharacterized protein n=1 Tax=Orbilia brochopaga TaxID=3140254 RepID=A0AAV9TZB4_9PEZI
MSAPEKLPVDVEGFPDHDFTPKHADRFRRRRRLAIAAVLALAIPTFLLTVDTGSPLEYLSLPSTRPRDTSMCDYYAQRTRYLNTAATQKSLVAAIVDAAFEGVLRPGDFLKGSHVDLTRYFDGSANTTNVDGVASRVSFLATGRDGRTHGNCRFHMMKEGMYRYFAGLLGCSRYGNTVDRYDGRSMREVHKYMDFEGTFDWAFFNHQFALGSLAAGFSARDAELFELYLIDTFGPRVDATGRGQPCFDGLSSDSVLPPPLDEASVAARAPEIAKQLFAGTRSHGAPTVIKRTVIGRQEASRPASTPPPLLPTPPPLTTPLLAPTPTATVPISTDASGEKSHNILPVALGAGIGAGIGVIIIGIVLAYFVIRKKRIQRRKSMPLMTLKSGLEMSKADAPARNPSRRVDRSEHGNVVGKPKDTDASGSSTAGKGHKKHDSVGVRSVRFDGAGNE